VLLLKTFSSMSLTHLTNKLARFFIEKLLCQAQYFSVMQEPAHKVEHLKKRHNIQLNDTQQIHKNTTPSITILDAERS